MLPNANGAACPRPVHRRLRPVASTLLAGILLVATGAATPGMAQHRGHHQGHHQGHAGHVAAKPQRTTADTPATAEFKAAHGAMMRNMAVPYTGDPDADFRIQMIPHHQGAIDMAYVAMRHAKDPWTRQLAEGVIVEQQREIAEMQAWLRRRGFAAPPTRHPTHTVRANSFRTHPEEPGTRAELRGQSWAPGAGIPAAR
ncbi:MAG TPA: DUF305 domain-containing protein, partial [Beijerinckiaceae bacterium]|nr:DUF305 domain-containing protein [Beijerinckiaceae bacterium]